MKKSFLTIMLIILAAFFLNGCYSAGKITGKAVDKVEEWTEEFRKGYEDAKE
ncbi:MAG: hypothetical protein GY749_07010 [Desulfobacteraceae bacterium]|nr:hypothetical protein [Desulfobacteraceae bacterium]